MKKRFMHFSLSNIFAISVTLLALSLFLILSIAILPVDALAERDESLSTLGMEYERLGIDVSVSSWLDIEERGSETIFSELEWQVFYYPVDGYQQVVRTVDISPSYERDGSAVVFSWEAERGKDLSSETDFSFDINAEIDTYTKQVQIKSKQPFPLRDYDIPDDIKQYLEPTSNADSSDPLIAALAESIVMGQDDQYAASHKLFSWVVENVEYKRTELTESTAQSASWALEKRYGVCDEMTMLLVAMARSVGIPARYVSGVAYSDYTESGWEPHGWAELYYPGTGWVPYDITYREAGFVDPTHLIFRYGIDSNQSSSTVRWLGRNIGIKQNDISIEPVVVERFGKAKELVDLRLELMKTKVSPGSYTLLKAEVTNLADSYVATEVSLTGTEGLTTTDSLNEWRTGKRLVYLAPGESKNVYWLIQVDRNLDSGYIYTFPIEAYAQMGGSEKTSLEAKFGHPAYTIDDMRKILDDAVSEEQLSYSRSVGLECKPADAMPYIYDPVSIICEAKNLGNVPLKAIEACVDEECVSFELGISKSNQFKFVLYPDRSGVFEKTVTIKSPDISKSEMISYNVQDIPSVAITDISHPLEVSYDELANITMLLKKASQSTPYDAVLIVEGVQTDTYKIGNMTADKEFTLWFMGSNLNPGDNEIRLIVSCKDLNGNSYTFDDTVNIVLKKPNIAQSIMLIIRDIALWVDGLFS